MNFFKKIDRAIVNRIDDAQEAAAMKTRCATLEMTKTEAAFVWDAAGLRPRDPLSTTVECARTFPDHHDSLQLGADALSFFRRLDRMVDEYEQEHGYGSATNPDPEEEFSLKNLRLDFVAAHKGVAGGFTFMAEGIRGAVRELAARYVGFEVRVRDRPGFSSGQTMNWTREEYKAHEARVREQDPEGEKARKIRLQNRLKHAWDGQ